MQEVLQGWFFVILGLSVGSFLNVVIDRLAYGKSILGRSQCDFCEKKLGLLDLIPVLSYILLLGKCRYCGKKLSIYYPLIEIVTAVVFFLGFRFFGYDYFRLFVILAIFSSFIVIFFTDLKYYVIPDEVQLFLLLFSFIYKFNCTQSCLFYGFQLFFSSLVSGFFVALPLLFLFYITKGKGLGFGDVKLGFNLGFLFGVKSGFLVLYLAFLLGGVLSVFLLISGRKNLKAKIPFGPFIVVSSFLFILVPDVILFYIRKFLFFI
ncbi:MAG: type 4 prepilin-like proteins leader peptide-processing enzyme [Patescibacteria group bacterium]|nr:MAG: type 4 prepilin-like proteins leader peptide-processing enzyme [Patescibacteria group bacterium]